MNDLFKPQMQPCAGRNCGSTNPNLHSAECFEDYEKATGMNQRKPLTDEEIDELMPVADGSAEVDVVPFELSPGIWGKEYSEVDAWSRSLVIQIARAIEAAHGIKGDA